MLAELLILCIVSRILRKSDWRCLFSQDAVRASIKEAWFAWNLGNWLPSAFSVSVGFPSTVKLRLEKSCGSLEQAQRPRIRAEIRKILMNAVKECN